MSASLDFRSTLGRTISLMEPDGIDGLIVMKPASLTHLPGEGRPCALGSVTR
jgi:hypothetical protein